VPAARLYLDNIQEITAVLLKYTPQDSTGGGRTVKFIVGNYECDSLDDLVDFGKEHGRRAVKFGINAFSADSRPTGMFSVEP